MNPLLYERVLSVPVPAGEVLEEASHFLTVLGYQIVLPSPQTLEARGPGLYSTSQNPILGASIIRLEITRQAVHAEADLTAMMRMQSFVLYFPLGLGVSLALFFAVMFLRWEPVLVAMLSVTPWVFLAPRLNAWIERRTRTALDTLLHNLVEPYTTVGGNPDEESGIGVP